MSDRDPAPDGLPLGVSRFALAAECRRTTWAMLPDSLAGMAASLLSPEAFAQVSARRDDRDETPTTGGVAIIPLTGVITPFPSLFSLIFGGGSGSLQMFRRRLREAVDDDAISSIVININSPGGSAAMLPETAAEMRDLRGAKPIVAVANTMAASAAYYLAAQADELYVTTSGQVGSIGTLMLHESLAGMYAQAGIEPTLITAGKYKGEGNDLEPLSEEAKAEMQRMVDECNEQFIADVAAGRGIKTNVVNENFGQGRMLTSKRALSAGMVDGVATLEDTIVRLARGGASRTRAKALGARSEFLQGSVLPVIEQAIAANQTIQAAVAEHGEDSEEYRQAVLTLLSDPTALAQDRPDVQAAIAVATAEGEPSSEGIDTTDDEPAAEVPEPSTKTSPPGGGGEQDQGAGLGFLYQ